MALKQVAYKDVKFEIAYDILNSNSSKIALFLHGWGSNKEVMKRAFENTLKEYKHIYIDLVGFGKSVNKNSILKTQDYANIVNEFLRLLDLKSSEITIFGHSFGGKVATLLNPKNLVLLSSAGIVETKSFKVKAKIKFSKILNFFGLKEVAKFFRSKDVDSMSEYMYATFKNVVDEDFTIYFEKSSSKTFIFWGEEDIATTISSGKKIHSLIKNSNFVSYSGGHYFFLEHSKDIAKRVENGIL